MTQSGNQINVGRDVAGNLIQGDGNTIINNDLDSEELGQSLGDAIFDNERRTRWEKLRFESEREESRQVMETAFVSLVSGLAIGIFWHSAFPWNVETVPFFLLIPIVLFNILRITNFGLRHSIIKVFLLSIAFTLLLQKTTLIQTLIDASQFAGTTFLSTIGAVIGLVVGVIQVFWRPLGD